MKAILAILPLVLVVGCIHAPQAKVGAALGETPPDPAAVSSCETTRTWHNIWTISASFFGAAAGAEGTADALVPNNSGVQTGIGIGVAGSGIIGAVAAAAAGIESDAYATGNCASILQSAANAGVHP